MIEHKSTMLIGYFVLLLVACGLPFALLLRRATTPSRWPSIVVGIAIAATSVALVCIRPLPSLLSPLVVAIPIALPLLRRGLLPFAGGLCALPLLAGVTWWNADLQLSLLQAVILLELGLAAVYVSLLPIKAGPPTGPALAGLAIVGLVVVLPSGQFATPEGLRFLWHHWGAYVAPVEALLSGGMPFRDFPIQYGIGPTLTIAALCGSNCFQGVYIATLGANVLYLVSLGGCALALTREGPGWLRWLAIVAIVPATMLWTAYPPELTGTIATPSVAGLRYLPITLLLWFALSHDDSRSDMPGHALWMLGLVWSPEAAFFATALWWPWLALRKAQKLESPTLPSVAVTVLGMAALACLAVIAGFAILAGVFRLAFASWPDLGSILTYIANPPGVLPANLSGPLPLVCIAIALLMLTLRTGDARQLRQNTACLITLIAVGSYYLGRSHDNNLLNLFPFVVLALVGAMAANLPAFLNATALVMIAGIIAWPATFGTVLLSTAWQSEDRGDIGPAHMLRLMRLDTPAATAVLNDTLVFDRPPASDLGEALAWLRSQSPQRPVVIDALMLMPPGAPGTAWTGMNNLAIFELLPDAVIKHFVAAGARSYHRAGWLLIDTSRKAPLLSYFTDAYDVAETRTFGGYTAYRMVPR